MILLKSLHTVLSAQDVDTDVIGPQVWKMFLERVKASEGMEVDVITEQDFESLARRNLNGRQIKNLTRAAQALAVHEEKPLAMEHIKRVIDVAETFETDLRGGTGFIEAMRGMLRAMLTLVRVKC